MLFYYQNRPAIHTHTAITTYRSTVSDSIFIIKSNYFRFSTIKLSC